MRVSSFSRARNSMSNSFVDRVVHGDVVEAMQAAGCAYDFPSELDRRFFAAPKASPHCQLTSGASSFKRVWNRSSAARFILLKPGAEEQPQELPVRERRGARLEQHFARAELQEQLPLLSVASARPGRSSQVRPARCFLLISSSSPSEASSTRSKTCSKPSEPP